MNIAIVGATGNVGRKILEVLEKKELSIDNLYLLASSKSVGKKISFKIRIIQFQIWKVLIFQK
jgi:aspartate-semialdehyde dehydrogenase